MDKKHQKHPQGGGFPLLVTPQDFFRNQAVSLLYPYGALTSCKKLEKNNKRSLRYSKTDRRTTDQRTDGQGRLLRTPSGKPKVQNGKMFHFSYRIFDKVLQFVVSFNTKKVKPFT